MRSVYSIHTCGWVQIVWDAPSVGLRGVWWCQIVREKTEMKWEPQNCDDFDGCMDTSPTAQYEVDIICRLIAFEFCVVITFRALLCGCVVDIIETSFSFKIYFINLHIDPNHKEFSNFQHLNKCSFSFSLLHSLTQKLHFQGLRVRLFV